MEGTQEDMNALRFKIQNLESELLGLRDRLDKAGVVESSQTASLLNGSALAPTQAAEINESKNPDWKWPLDAEEYRRYGRQMIMPEIGLEGQLRLKDTSVLIVGVGGLGCPAACYLAGAGVGTLGLMDGDEVETSNLHRQILHSAATVGQSKVFSAIQRLRQLNPTIKYRAHPSHMDPRMAPDVIDQYDVVLDCTDRPTSRYLISDAAVIARKPLVSASALKTEGQLLVLNWPLSTPESSEGGVCYRCVFPKPPPIESVVDCGAGGILGPVVGVMGVLMAVETMKIIVGMQSPRSPQDPSKSFSASPSPTLLLYSALSHPPFRSIRLRGKRPTCPSCSATPSITRESLVTGSTDYAFFCGITSTSTSTSTSPTYNNNGNNITPPSPKTDRISATAYAKIHHQASSPSQSHILIDVREKAHFDICHLEHSVNIPFSSLLAVIPPTQTSTSTTPLSPTTNPSPSPSLANHPALKHISHLQKYPETPVFVLCRFGNDSQVAVQKLKAWIRAGAEPNPPSTPSSPESTQAKPQITTSSSSSPHSHPHPQIQIRDISGGLASWRKEVDTEFPEY